MNLQELVRSVLREYGPELVAVRISDLHKEEIDEGHYVAMCALDTKLVPKAQEPPMTLHVRWITDQFDGYRYLDVSGVNGKRWADMDGPGDSMADELVLWGLEMSSWEEWAGFTVPDHRAVPAIDFVAACIWVMSCFGHSPGAAEQTMADVNLQLADIRNPVPA